MGEQLWVRRPGLAPLASVRFQDTVSGGRLPTQGQRTQALKTSLRKICESLSLVTFGEMG